MKLSDKLLLRPGKPVALADWDPDDTLGFQKEPATEEIEKGMARLDALQYLLYAEHRRALLVVLQGRDGAGKDGTIRHVMRGFNPQGCRVTAFRTPTADEADHDFLWRVHHAVPPRGNVAIFNRSHYEDVLVARVRKLVPKEVWSRRYEHINRFERLLVDSGILVVKFFLHISKGEQRQRFEERLRDPTKQWKLSPSDFEDRQHWDDYTVAYEEALSRCSTPEAPWFLVPADRKWVRNVAVADILVETLEGLHMQFPKPSFDVSRIKVV
ncbi:MAG TPA: polyphosphate kinase 2 family protein [Candidatus Dormibacteraeota bacterium]|nr:polyphosphate kinase 2 family protein [Candidatus Dormibacteraeota bacterium]